MDTNKYDVGKFRKIIETTLSNYANMIKRLERKKSISEFVLTYYSIFLIITTLTGKYFPAYYDITVSEYFNIILSVIVLIYSLIIKNADYSTRITNIMDSLNQLKTIKREIDDNSLDECSKRYNDIVDKTERRNDVDFFITVKHLCKSFDINWFTKKHRKTKNERILQGEELEEFERQEKIVKGYISEINVVVEQSKIILELLWYVFLFIIPIVLFVLCVLSQMYKCVQ